MRLTKEEFKAFTKTINNYPKLDTDQKSDVKSILASNYSFVRTGQPTSRKFEVDEIKRYDVIYAAIGAIMPHHFVVFKIDDDTVYCLSITSKKTPFSDKFKITKNRVFNDSYFSTTIHMIDLDTAKKSFVFVYSEGRKEFDRYIKEMKEFYNTLLK